MQFLMSDLYVTRQKDQGPPLNNLSSYVASRSLPPSLARLRVFCHLFLSPTHSLHGIKKCIPNASFGGQGKTMLVTMSELKKVYGITVYL